MNTITQRPVLSEEQIYEIAQSLSDLALSNDEVIRAGVAVDKYTSQETLALLSKDKSREVRIYTSGNPNISIETLKALLSDEDEVVRECASYNSLNTFLSYATGEDTVLQAAAASDPTTPIEILNILSGNKNPETRAVVAANHRVPQDTFLKLLSDEDPVVREYCGYNPRYLNIIDE